MKNIKDFIYYYRSCPLCKNWITLDADLPFSVSLEIKEDRLMFTIVGNKEKKDKAYSILFKNNKIESDIPFVFDDLISVINRLYNDKYTTKFKIEARCYSCSNFRYWSRPIIYNERTKKISNIGVAGERAQLHELNEYNEKISYIISNNYTEQTTSVHLLRSSVKKVLKLNMPFLEFNEINFDDRESILNKIKKASILA